MLLSIILFPLSVSLREASKSNSIADEAGLATYYGTGKTEEILAMDFPDIPISSPTGTPVPSISDTVTIRGRTVNRDVYVDLADGDGDAVPDSGLKNIKVTVYNITIDVLKADYPYATF